ncbi:MAG: methyltransferase domain-containing protein [Hydrogenophaga sp.]|nr:methyltransferase domain-containing protein [Hydrogenophaga sp.]
MNREAVMKSYRRHAGGYDLYFGAVLHPGRKAVLARMNLQPGEHVLEVGVGTGLSLPLYPRDVRVTGIDLSQEMLARAEDSKQRLGLDHVALHCMDAERMDFPDHSFDKVVAMYVVSVAPDPVRLVNEMRRVCKPGGQLYIVNHFQQAGTLTGFLSRVAAPFTGMFGVRPNFMLDRFLRDTRLVVAEQTQVNLLGYSTLLRADPGAVAPASSRPT